MMKKVNTFNCCVKQIDAALSNMSDCFELVCQYTSGREVVLHKGSHLDCLGAMEKYFHRLICDPSRNVVRWLDKQSFVVHEIVDQDHNIILG